LTALAQGTALFVDALVGLAQALVWSWQREIFLQNLDFMPPKSKSSLSSRAQKKDKIFALSSQETTSESSQASVAKYIRKPPTKRPSNQTLVNESPSTPLPPTTSPATICGTPRLSSKRAQQLDLKQDYLHVGGKDVL
jgi:hypothetical protein